MLQKINKSILLIVIIGISFFAIQAISQIKITGKITDKNAPIPSANVILLDANQKFVVGCWTTSKNR